jgi:phosphoribosylglycinamide formyltransferase-1
MIKIGILSSYNGTGFLALEEAIKNKIVDAKIEIVISNNSTAQVLQKASEKNIPNFVVNKSLYDNEDMKICDLMKEYKVDYIFLSGYMKKIENNLLSNFPNRIINSHPALLPKHGGKGMYGRFVHEAVIKNSEKESGCTIHFVNENYDEGRYILQKKISLNKDETVDTLENRIKLLEQEAIVEAFLNLA